MIGSIAQQLRYPMKHPTCRIPNLAVLFTLVALVPPVFAADDAAARWKQYEPSFQAFADEDRAKPPKQGGFLFVGSKPDKLHFHLDSYKVFAAVIKPVLERVWREVSASSLSPAKGR